MFQFDDILLLFFNLITNRWRNIHIGLAIICVKIKIKTRLWDPVGIIFETHVVQDPQKNAGAGPRVILPLLNYKIIVFVDSFWV